MRVSGCSRKAVIKGIKELKELYSHSLFVFEPRIRNSGGERKHYDVIYHNIANLKAEYEVAGITSKKCKLANEGGLSL